MSSCCKPSQSCCAPTNNQGVVPTPSTSTNTKLVKEENKQKEESCCSTAPSGCCEQSTTNSDNLNLSSASANEVRNAVSHAYAARLAESVASNATKAAAGSTGCCAPGACGGVDGAAEYSMMLGYSAEDVKDGVDSNFGLGCGNPTALAGLSEGEVVLDLGSGAGFDCFLAAKRVGVTGRVIGVDMTAEMITKARENAEKRKATNVQFIQSTMESLPLANDSIDVILSNCVLNLSPEKSLVFSEAFRVLKPGGRLHISDLIATKEIPQNIKNDLSMHCGCMAGATPKDQLQTMLQKTGFHKINIQEKQESKNFIAQWAPGSKVEEYIVSAYISAYKSK